VRLFEHAAGAPAELLRLPFVSDRESSDRKAVDRLEPRRELVAPCDVVAGAGGDDFDRCVPGKPLGYVAGVQLRAAVDVSAIPLDNDRELHDSEGPLSSLDVPPFDESPLSDGESLTSPPPESSPM
jgi:hypothetical protein